jgi:hypothetical protein
VIISEDITLHSSKIGIIDFGGLYYELYIKKE